jgi:hypothetical protein
VNRLLHAPTTRMKELRDERVHARMALVRDLFGLAAEDVAAAPQASPAAKPGAKDERLAEVRQLRP